MSIYAHVKDGKVVNTSVWDGLQSYTPPEGVEMVLLSESDEPHAGMAGIGWDFVDGEFIDNRPIEEDD